MIAAVNFVSHDIVANVLPDAFGDDVIIQSPVINNLQANLRCTIKIVERED